MSKRLLTLSLHEISPLRISFFSLLLIITQSCVLSNRSSNASNESFEEVISHNNWYTFRVYPEAGVAKLNIFRIQNNQMADSLQYWRGKEWKPAKEPHNPYKNKITDIRYLILQDTGWKSSAVKPNKPALSVAFNSDSSFFLQEDYITILYDFHRKSSLYNTSISSLFPGKEWGFPKKPSFSKEAESLQLLLSLKQEVFELFDGYWACVKDSVGGATCRNYNNKEFFRGRKFTSFSHLQNFFNTRHNLLPSWNHPYYGYHFNMYTNIVNVYQIEDPLGRPFDSPLYVGEGKWSEINHHKKLLYEISFPTNLPDSLYEYQSVFQAKDIFSVVNDVLHPGRRVIDLYPHAKETRLFNKKALLDILDNFSPKTIIQAR